MAEKEKMMKIMHNEKEYEYSQGDELYISAAISEMSFIARNPSKILLCYPPK